MPKKYPVPNAKKMKGANNEKDIYNNISNNIDYNLYNNLCNEKQ